MFILALKNGKKQNKKRLKWLSGMCVCVCVWGGGGGGGGVYNDKLYISRTHVEYFFQVYIIWIGYNEKQDEIANWSHIEKIKFDLKY